MYWTYDVPAGESRGGHAHKQLYQLVVAMSGSFIVNIDNGKEKKSVLLNHPWEGLLITPGVWRTLDDFSSGAVCMVLASELYDEEDYIYEYEDFLEYVKVKDCNDNNREIYRRQTGRMERLCRIGKKRDIPY